MAQKNRITDLEQRVRDAKNTYNEALRLLEQISEEIHRQRAVAAADAADAERLSVVNSVEDPTSMAAACIASSAEEELMVGRIANDIFQQTMIISHFSILSHLVTAVFATIIHIQQ